MKICSKCRQEKPLDSFYSKGSRGYQSWCKNCDKEYQNNRPQVEKQHKNKGVAERKKALQLYLSDYKTKRGCKDCGENHPACLDLHHRNAQEKSINPSNMWRFGWSLDKIKLELAKCDVLCSNCHRKFHAVVTQPG